MKYCQYLVFVLALVFPSVVFSQVVVQGGLLIGQTDDDADSEVFAIYDLRDRSTYVQITNTDPDENPMCIHVQIFQQDSNCDELDFNDTLTPNDTVVYNLDNIVRNNGTPVPINLDDNSYGYVAVSSLICGTTSDRNTLMGNFRIIDDSGYEYRMNMISGEGVTTYLDFFDGGGTPPPPRGNIIIPFNTVDGASNADIFAFVADEDRFINGVSASEASGSVYNEEAGITFEVFQIDENEERLSCDRKTIGCGPDVAFNYGINEDYPASRGNNLLCEGGGLLPGQTHGYISLENPSFLPSVDIGSGGSEFFCFYGLNNGNGTGSIDQCLFNCTFGVDSDNNNCNPPPT